MSDIKETLRQAFNLVTEKGVRGLEKPEEMVKGGIDPSIIAMSQNIYNQQPPQVQGNQGGTQAALPLKTGFQK